MSRQVLPVGPRASAPAALSDGFTAFLQRSGQFPLKLHPDYCHLFYDLLSFAIDFVLIIAVTVNSQHLMQLWFLVTLFIVHFI